MKTKRSFSRWGILIHFIVFTSSFGLHGGETPSLNLGSGEPGLKIIYQTADHAAIYLDEPGTLGFGLMGGYQQRHIEVLFDQNYGLKQIIQNAAWTDDAEQLYPFDEKSAFTCDGGAWSSDFKRWNYWPRKTQLFSTNTERILLPNDVYVLARLRYGLSSNQLFLGKIETNIFYWEASGPPKVYFRVAGQQGANDCFELPKRIIDVFGATKAVNKGKDIAFVVFGRSTGFFHYAPNEFSFIEFSYKEAKHKITSK